MRKWRHSVAVTTLLAASVISAAFIFLEIPDGGPAIPLGLIVLCVIAIALVIPRRIP